MAILGLAGLFCIWQLDSLIRRITSTLQVTARSPSCCARGHGWHRRENLAQGRTAWVRSPDIIHDFLMCSCSFTTTGTWYKQDSSPATRSKHLRKPEAVWAGSCNCWAGSVFPRKGREQRAVRMRERENEGKGKLEGSWPLSRSTLDGASPSLPYCYTLKPQEELQVLKMLYNGICKASVECLNWGT